MKILLNESQFLRIVEDLEESPGNFIIIKNSNLLSFYKDVKKKTYGQKIDLTTIEVVLNDKGESYIKYKLSSKSKSVVILIPYSEEIDNGKCPSCDNVRKLNPNNTVVKDGKFGKKRLYQVIAIPAKAKKKKKGPIAKNYSWNTLNLLKSRKTEDFRTQVYDDKCPDAEAGKRCGGKLTIGYGTLVSEHPELAKYAKGSKYHLSKERAEVYLKQHLDKNVVPIIKEKITTPLTQNEFDALSIFLYNMGDIGENLQKSINDEDEENIKKYWKQYIYWDGNPSSGLMKRRAEELSLFFK
jgi:GH24 family phage-related lysozyme (muramidase)